MRRLSLGRLAPCLLAGLALTAMPQTSHAQGEPQKIGFESPDKVLLQGKFYSSAKAGKQSPTVLLVPKLGSDSDAQGWDDLAKDLAKAGYSVLSFDWRGTGGSTNVKEEFWDRTKYPYNNGRNIKGAKPKKETIEWKELQPSYYPVLVNDLAAAKYTLEKKNNAEDCNVGDTIIIAAEDGATVAALWLATEWQHRRPTLGMGGVVVPGEPEGKDIAALVCLSVRPSMGTGASARQGAVPLWLAKDPKIPEKVGMYFIYGKGDINGGAFAKLLYDTVSKSKAKNKATFKPYEIPDTKLAGNELLKGTLPAREAIVEYIGKKVIGGTRPGTVWDKRDLTNNLLECVPLDRFGIQVPK